MREDFHFALSAFDKELLKSKQNITDAKHLSVAKTSILTCQIDFLDRELLNCLEINGVVDGELVFYTKRA